MLVSTDALAPAAVRAYAKAAKRCGAPIEIYDQLKIMALRMDEDTRRLMKTKMKDIL